MSSVPRHSEEELRQQWAFLDALVDRQASSLRAGSQDPEEDDLAPVVAAPETSYLEEISTLTRRVSTLEGERFTLLRRLDLAEEARMAAEEARVAAEAGKESAERALASARADAADARIGQGLPATREPQPETVAAPESAGAAAVVEEPSVEAPPVVAPVPMEVPPTAPPAMATEPAPDATSEEPSPVLIAPVEAAAVASHEEVRAPVMVAPEPEVAAPQKAAAAAPAPVKPRRKTWWQRLRG